MVGRVRAIAARAFIRVSYLHPFGFSPRAGLQFLATWCPLRHGEVRGRREAFEAVGHALGGLEDRPHSCRREFDAGAPGVPPYGLGGQDGFGFASDGTNLFFCEFDVSKIGAFDPVAHGNLGNFSRSTRASA